MGVFGSIFDFVGDQIYDGFGIIGVEQMCTAWTIGPGLAELSGYVAYRVVVPTCGCPIE
jgi:hypothetical protein